MTKELTLSLRPTPPSPAMLLYGPLDRQFSSWIVLLKSSTPDHGGLAQDRDWVWVLPADRAHRVHMMVDRKDTVPGDTALQNFTEELRGDIKRVLHTNLLFSLITMKSVPGPYTHSQDPNPTTSSNLVGARANFLTQGPHINLASKQASTPRSSQHRAARQLLTADRPVYCHSASLCEIHR